MFLFWLLLSGLLPNFIVSFHELQGQFKFCDTAKSKPYDVSSACPSSNSNRTLATLLGIEQFENNIIAVAMHVLAKKSNEVLGYGFECKKEKIESYYQEDIWFSKLSPNHVKMTIQLTTNECYEMILSKKCGDKQMYCEDQECFYKEPNIPFYRYLETVKQTTYHCLIKSRVVIAKTMKSPLFGKNCYALDKFCRLHDSIVVWNDTVVQDCSLSRIMSTDFELENGNILLGITTPVAFQITGEENVSCKSINKTANLRVFTTEQGLFISEFNDWENLALEESKTNALLLADLDSTHIKIIKKIDVIDHALCNLLISQLQSMAKSDDEFFTINSNKDHEYVLYSKNSLVRLPDCFNVSDVSLSNNSEICYEDWPVTYTLDHHHYNGFISKNVKSIIRTNSKITNCKELVGEIPISINSYILRNGTNYTIINESTQGIKFADDKTSQMNILHLDINKNTELSKFLEIKKSADWDSIFVYDSKNESIESFFNSIVLFFKFKIRNFLYIISIVCASLVAIVIGCFCFCYCKKNKLHGLLQRKVLNIRKKRNNKKNSSQRPRGITDSFV